MNYFDHNAAQQGMPAHRDAPRENIPAPDDPMAAKIRAALAVKLTVQPYPLIDCETCGHSHPAGWSCPDL